MKIKLNSKLFFFIMLAFVVILIVGSGAALYFADSLLKKRSSDVVTLKIENQRLDEQLNVYRSAKKDLTKYADLDELVSRVIPTEKDQARIVREIVTLANDNGIQI